MRKKKNKGQLKYVYRHIKRLLGLVKENFSLGAIKIVLGIIGGLFGILLSYITGQLLDIALEGDTVRLIQLAVILVILQIIDTVSDYVSIYLAGKYRIGCGKTLRRKACKKINDLSISYYENNHTGATVSTLINDIEKLEKFFLAFVEDICSYFPSRLIGGLIVSLVLNYELTIICLFIIPLLGYLTGKITLKLGKTTSDIQNETEKYNSLLRDFIGGIHIYKAYNMQESFDPKIEEACEVITQKSFIISKVKNLAYGIREISYTIPSILAYIVGGVYVLRGEMTIGELFIFVNVFFSVIGSFERLSASWATIIESAGISEHFYKLLDAQEERVTGKDYTNDEFILEFRNVSFSYKEGIEVLKGISFIARKGEKVAIVGASGSGKTTIYKLIAGHYDYYNGEILINNHELSTWNLSSVRDIFSPMTQEVGLFCDTIKNNINFGDIHADENRIVDASRKANAHLFIKAMDNGFDSMIGEGGAKLSGGQRQRIALARTILKNAPVFLLDEPTSALDTKSEYFVQQAIKNMSENKTVIVIAHRLSTIVNADKIVVLDGGKVAEIGYHDELIKRNGKYTELYKRQLIQEGEGTA